MTRELEKLLREAEARSKSMSDEERTEQRISFALGNVNTGRLDPISRELVEEVASHVDRRLTLD
jgi:hypothetical protein